MGAATMWRMRAVAVSPAGHGPAQGARSIGTAAGAAPTRFWK
jgi:hypothetical protein